MFALQISVIIFLLFILAIVYQDEYKKRKLARKSARLNRFWDPGKEKRKTVRIETELNVLYEVTGHNVSQKRNSVSRNISLGGINLVLNEKLLPGTILKLQLDLPESPQPIFVEAKTVWVKEIAEKFIPQKEQRFFATGIQFLKLAPADEVTLQNFINMQIKNAQESQV